MEEPIIQARDLGICFAKGKQKKGRVKDLFVRRSANKKGAAAQDFWPLRHVNFDIFPGDAVGIIGRNGTGKSTLLRLITGVLIPDEGYVRREGRVAPLIALSAGFSGDLTGTSLEAVTSRDAAVRGHRLFDVRDLDGIALHPPIQRFLRRWQPGDPVAYLGALWAP